MENINYLWLLSIYDILGHKQKKYHVKNHFISASSFCVVMKKAESVPTVLSLPLYLGRAGSRHGQGWAKPTQMTVLPTQSELDKDYVNLFVHRLKLI